MRRKNRIHLQSLSLCPMQTLYARALQNRRIAFFADWISERMRNRTRFPRGLNSVVSENSYACRMRVEFPGLARTVAERLYQKPGSLDIGSTIPMRGLPRMNFQI